MDGSIKATVLKLVTHDYGHHLPLIDGEGDHYRCERLCRAYIAYLVEGGEPERILMLRDHEGTLTVTWVSQPTELEQKNVRAAWNSQDEDHVMHAWPGEAE